MMDLWSLQKGAVIVTSVIFREAGLSLLRAGGDSTVSLQPWYCASAQSLLCFYQEFPVRSPLPC